ncbi:uncharacterized protein LOC142171710 [Nicotiana tabacum]|uniref:Uncharacterized protein LOC142171710 n=1 Tax=Nicotiana tabacum TaxID=4097 RepID=A0AC58T2Q9_TOBAC
MNNQIDGPWSILGDFNVIMETNEKKGGRLHRLSKSLKFQMWFTVERISHGLMVEKQKRKRILQRLDRVFYNDAWSSTFNISIVCYLPRIGSDHNVLLLNCSKSVTPPIKYFKFLNFWVDHPNFMDAVKGCWDEYVQGNVMYSLHQKLKSLAHYLSRWSKEYIGNVFDKIDELEQKVDQMEFRYAHDSESNRTRLHCLYAEQIRWMNMENAIL